MEAPLSRLLLLNKALLAVAAAAAPRKKWHHQLFIGSSVLPAATSPLPPKPYHTLSLPPLIPPSLRSFSSSPLASRSRGRRPYPTPDATEIQQVLERLRAFHLKPAVIQYLVSQGTNKPGFLTLGDKVELMLTEGCTLAQVTKMLTHRNIKVFVSASYQKILSYFIAFRATRWELVLALTHHPQLISTPLETLEECFKFLEGLGFGRDALMRILTITPTVLAVKVKALEQRYHAVLALGLTQDTVLKIFSGNPNAFKFRVESTKLKIDSLQDLGLDIKSVGKILSRSPSFLSMNPAGSFKTKIAFFERMGMSRNAICYVLRVRPTVLCLSVERNISAKMELLERLGFDFKSESALKSSLHLTNLSSALLEKRFDGLKARGFSHSDVAYMVQRLPQILHRREEHIARCIDYFDNVLNRDRQQLVKFPQFFGYSFERRILPRCTLVAEMKRKGLLKRELSLNSILAVSNEVFASRFALRRKALENSGEVFASSRSESDKFGAYSV